MTSRDGTKQPWDASVNNSGWTAGRGRTSRSAQGSFHRNDAAVARPSTPHTRTGGRDAPFGAAPQGRRGVCGEDETRQHLH